MRKFKVAGLALAAIVALAGCATDGAVAEELPVTGGEVMLPQTGDYELSYPSAIEIRDDLVTRLDSGLDVEEQLTEVCADLAGLDGIYFGNAEYEAQWLARCANPDYSWNADSNEFVPHDEVVDRD